MRKFPNVQSHRLKAFSKTLVTLETVLEGKILFIIEVADLYKFNKTLARRHLKRYRRWLQAVKHLKDLEQKNL